MYSQYLFDACVAELNTIDEYENSIPILEIIRNCTDFNFNDDTREIIYTFTKKFMYESYKDCSDYYDSYEDFINSWSYREDESIYYEDGDINKHAVFCNHLKNINKLMSNDF